MFFEDLGLIAPILKALETEGYDQPTPIQAQSIPLLLQRRDLLGCAQTGTGKTAAFAIPILQILHEEQRKGQRSQHISALILTPTRELAIQIGESFSAYGCNTGVKHLVVFGGVSDKPQINALKGRNIDVLIATPGRLLDLMNQGYISLQQIKMFVLDEADRMLDMGFIHDVKRVIAKLPERRQSLFFSATMPPDVSKLAHSILTNPVKVEVTPASSTVDIIDQSVYFVGKGDKKALLVQLLRKPEIQSALIFTRTKHGANKVAGDLSKAGIHAEAIHGNKSQTARQKALANFKSRQLRVLVATDIAARGIDVEELSHVINFELPNIPETYVHRIGRTGRAGATGTAISFCDAEEKAFLKDIQKLIGKNVPVVEEHPFPLSQYIAPAPTQDQQWQQNRQPRNERPSQFSRERSAQPERKSGPPAGGSASGSRKRRGWSGNRSSARTY